MTFRHSLRSRIIIAFCLFGSVLGIVYATAVYISLDLIDDHLIDSRLNEGVEYFISHYERYNDYPRPTSPYITAYVGTESMPLYVLDMIKGFAEGQYEAYSDDQKKFSSEENPAYRPLKRIERSVTNKDGTLQTTCTKPQNLHCIKPKL